MLAWVSSYFVCTEFRKAMVDPFLAFFTLVAVCAWVAADLRCDRNRRWRWLALVAYAAVGIGAMCKGPVILVHVIIALLAFHLTRKRPPRFGKLIHLLGVATILALALPWPVVVALRVPGAIDLWRAESVGNLAEQTRNARPFWTYVPMVFQISLPWTLPWLMAHWRDLRRLRRASGRAKQVALANLFPLVWLVGAVVFFSFAHMKKPAYLLPLMPAIVLPAARGIVLLLRAALRPGGQVSRWVIGGHATVGGVFAIGASIAVYQKLDNRTLAILVCTSIVLAGFIPFLTLSISRLRWWLTAQALAFCVAASLGIALRHAAMDRLTSSRKLDALVIQMIAADPDLTLLDSRLPAEAAVYLPADIRRDPSRSRVLMIFDPDGEARAPDSAALARLLPFTVESVRRIPVDESITKRWELWEFTTKSSVRKR
jgi:4-amino-4-deoxy-L-arabinose transferase-like glycosyltransferase